MGKIEKSVFVAIAVKEGDAFFIARGDKTALIDGGRSRFGFAQQFGTATTRNRVDVVICTHNDADHALGVLGFLDTLHCKEVWLPGSWTDRLSDLLLNQSKFFEELVADIRGVDLSDEMPRPFLESLGDHYSGRDNRQQRETGADLRVEELEKILEDPATDYLGLLWPYSPLWRPSDWWFLTHELLQTKEGDQKRFDLLLEALSAANRIQEISRLAYRSGAQIRWFEYHQSVANGGINSFLLPVNARELVRFRQNRWSVLQYLAVTTANKESLVFRAPANERECAVLFTADSDFSFNQPVGWSDGMIITAPHHGSEANSMVYKQFAAQTSASLHAIWVRSDGRRLGSSYLKVRGRRFCTLCRGSHTSQDVRFSAAPQRWKPAHTTACSCV